MRFGYKLLILFLVSLFLVSSVQAAVIAGVKVYHGENFTSSIGGTFMLYGSSPYTKYNNATDNIELFYKNVIISSTIDDTVNIRNGTCESTKKYLYCFKSSTIDMTKSKTFQYGEYLQPMMSITIESLPSPISVVTFNRTPSLKAYCGEEIPVLLIVKNAGALDTNMTYTEFLPFNTVIMSTEKGRVDGNIITFKDNVPPGASRNYTYVLLNSDCESKKWNATYSFTTFNDTLQRNLTNLNITMQNSYNITTTLSANKTNNLNTEITYTMKISNIHPSINEGLDISLSAPGTIITDVSKDLVQSGEVYRYIGNLPVGSSMTLYLKFHAKDYGDYLIYNTASVNMNNHVDEHSFNKTLQVLPAKVDTYMSIDTTKNNSLSIGIWAKNYDVVEKYYYIYGILKGFAEEEPIYANGINPDSTLSIANRTYNTTGMGNKEITLIFDGIYRDKNSIEHPIRAEQKILLNSPPELQPNSTSSNNVIIKKNTSTSVPIKITTPVKPAGNTSNNSTVVPKKDFVTRVIEGLSNFLQSIFG